MGLVVNVQLAGRMHEGFVAKGVEGLGIARRSHQPRATHQPPAGAVLKHEEVAFLAVEDHLGCKRGFRGQDLFTQPFHIIRQRRDAQWTVRSQALDFSQVGKLRGAHHQHAVTPVVGGRYGTCQPWLTRRATARSKRFKPSSISASSITRLGAKRTTSGPACRTIRASFSAAARTWPALPSQPSVSCAPISRPRPRISSNRPYCAPICCRRVLKISWRALTPLSTSGVLTISSTAPPTAQPSGLPP